MIRPVPSQAAWRLACRAAAAAVLALLAACAVNPATGERQFSLISETQEIELGRGYDPQVLAEMGIYPDSQVQRYVRGIGEGMARASERPTLPWTIRVVDDPLVNAFAVPGGYLYVTRGILAHINSEAELAGILGHEIGHVTARHSVTQMSRSQLARIGLGVGVLLRPDLQEVAGLAEAGLGVLFLKYGRDAEYQSDDLGLRYMRSAGYDPREMAAVFRTLASLADEGEGGRPPEWASTHPFPQNREARVLSALGTEAPAGLRTGRNEMLDRLSGLVYGDDPREGFFRGTAFFHPDLAFRLDFPAGWRTQNARTSVQGMSAEEDAMIQLDVAEESTAAGARAAFLATEGMQAGARADRRVNGLPAAFTEFGVSNQSGNLLGLAAFIEHGGSVYRVLGYTTQAAWRTRQATITAALESFQRVTDRAVLDVRPRRLEIVTLPAAMTFAEFLRRFPSSEDDAAVARINGVALDARLEAGRKMKRVVGQRP